MLSNRYVISVLDSWWESWILERNIIPYEKQYVMGLDVSYLCSRQGRRIYLECRAVILQGLVLLPVWKHNLGPFKSYRVRMCRNFACTSFCLEVQGSSMCRTWLSWQRQIVPRLFSWLAYHILNGTWCVCKINSEQYR